MKAALTAILPLLMLASGGCIIIPTPPHKSDAYPTRQNISCKDASEIQVHVTSREQVLLRFGEPDATFEERQRFIYLWAEVTAWWFAAAGYSGAGGEIGQGYMLEVDFDACGIVRRREIRTPGLTDLFRTQNVAGVVYAPHRSPAP